LSINETGSREEDGPAPKSSSANGIGSDLGPKRIVKFEVHPMSYQHHYDTKRELFDPQTVTTCNTRSWSIDAEIGNGQNQLLNFKDKSQKIIFSYSVEWIESETPWAKRWDVYLGTNSMSGDGIDSMGGDMPDNVHWLSITNSILGVVFLSALVVLIMVRKKQRSRGRAVIGYRAGKLNPPEEHQNPHQQTEEP
jgi:hypothetical protein